MELQQRDLLIDTGYNLLAEGSARSAIGAFTQALVLDPRSVAAYGGRASASTALQKHDLAVSDLNQAIVLLPNCAELYINRARAFRELGKIDAALADLTHALELSPTNPDIYLKRARAQWAINPEGALKDLSTVIRLKPDHLTAYLDRGRLRHRQRQFSSAIEDFTAIINADAGIPGVMDLKRMALEEALNTYTGAIHHVPTDARSRRDRGVLFMHLGQLEAALTDTTRAIELDPTDAANWFARANIRFHLKWYRRALLDFDKAIELNPSDARAWSNRGGTHYHLGQYEQAYQDLSRAVTLDPSLLNAYLNRAMVLMQQQRPAEALTDLDLAEPPPSRDYTHLHLRAHLLVALGRTHDAGVDLRRALALRQDRIVGSGPTVDDIQSFLDRLNRGDLPTPLISDTPVPLPSRPPPDDDAALTWLQRAWLLTRSIGVFALVAVLILWMLSKH